MKKFVIAFTALSALAATPALARSDTHISFGFYSPTPVVYQPAPVYYAPPVVYYPPVRHVYYAPPRHYGHAYGHRKHYRDRDYAWNDRNDRGRWRH